jgi:hypothetical protein
VGGRGIFTHKSKVRDRVRDMRNSVTGNGERNTELVRGRWNWRRGRGRRTSKRKTELVKRKTELGSVRWNK